MDWTEIEDKLKERAMDVVQHLLPGGRAIAGEWCCGDLTGKAGESLKVNLKGKVGVWRDFHEGSGGKSLMSLWCAVRGQEFKVCIREAKEWLGIKDDFAQRAQPYGGASVEVKPDESGWQAVAKVWEKCAPLTEGGPVWSYLVGTRKLDAAVLEAFQVRQFISGGKWAMVFPYFAAPDEEDGSPLVTALPVPEWLKFELVERVDGKKREWTSRAPEKSLFGVQLAAHPAFKKCKDVILCEGEKDALTWAGYGCAQWGCLPVSVPFGAKWRGQDKGRPSPNREWLDRNWAWLENFESVFVAMDGDDAGKKAAADIVKEIGPRRCRVVVLPAGKKDANECLLAGVPPAAMRAALDNALDFSPDKVKNASALEREFMEEWFEKHIESGLQLPVDFNFKIRLGEMTVWTGIEKSGKTTFLSFCMNALMTQGERCLVTGFETRTAKNLKKISRQAAGGIIYDARVLDKCRHDDERATYTETAKGRAREVLAWLGRNLWVYDHVGIVQWRQLIDDFRWARRRLGITQFVVDNFMRLGIVKDDYAQQAECITALANLSMELDAHIHVVVHQNKSEGHKGKSSGKRTVSGAFEIIANAHNIVEVQRDEDKGIRVCDLFQNRKIGAVKEEEFSKTMAELKLVPDGKVILHAQRDGEQQNGSKYLWFLWESQQYCSGPEGHEDHQPIYFVPVNRNPKAELPTNEEMGL